MQVATDTQFNALQLDPRDNVAVATRALASGDRARWGADMRACSVADSIPPGHKLACEPIPAGAAVYKFGAIIGIATLDIGRGSHVHVHNLREPEASDAAVNVKPASAEPFVAMDGTSGTFEGFLRADGSVGTRNFIGILPTVNCSVSVARMIAAEFSASAHVDGVIALGHGSGCGMARTGPGFELLRRTLAGYARHPNFAGVLLIGLGCEQNQVDEFMAAEGLDRQSRIASLVIQDSGGTRGAVAAGVARVRTLIEQAAGERRRSLPLSGLRLGLQCGGSDAFSGITANPALGRASDLLVRAGATVVLSETPEILGAESLLLQRARTSEVADRLLQRLSWWQTYADANGAVLQQNPSPGNRAGGISTLTEKSLGGIMKAGSSRLQQVIDYAAPLGESGLVFMDSPGYDPVAVTGQVAAGCNVICFTTGRGSVFGCRPVPSLKLATTTALYERMPEDIDVNCGAILDGDMTLDEMGREIVARIVATASGQPVQNEQFACGGDEFQPWPLGAVL